MNEPEGPGDARKPLLEAWFEGPTLRRGLRVSAVVGTALLAINQGEALLEGEFPAPWKVLLTYLVPYAVSTWSSVAALRERESDHPGH